MTDLPNQFLTRILARFMNEEELSQLLEDYQDHRFIQRGFKPTDTDWKMYHDPSVSLKEWQKRWKLKSMPAVYARLVKMKFMEPEKKKGK